MNRGFRDGLPPAWLAILPCVQTFGRLETVPTVVTAHRLQSTENILGPRGKSREMLTGTCSLLCETRPPQKIQLFLRISDYIMAV